MMRVSTEITFGRHMRLLLQNTRLTKRSEKF